MTEHHPLIMPVRDHDALLQRLCEQSRFLQLRSVAERKSIFVLASRTAQDLDRWAQQWPLVRRERIAPVSLMVAASAPFVDVDSLVLTARHTLWIFLLDDLIDEGRLTEAQLQPQAERYRALARGDRGLAATESSEQILAGVRADLQRLPLWRDLGQHWARELAGTIDAMLREHDWRRAYRGGNFAALPSYEAYRANGLYSIGGPPHVCVSFIVLGDASVITRALELRPLIDTASICIRLNNDLRTAGKEAAEDNVNSLVLTARALLASGSSPEGAAAGAEAVVQQDIAAGLAALEQLVATRHTSTGHPEALIDNLAHFVCDFYQDYDFHTAGAAYTPPVHGQQDSEELP
jgi:hypothetical protein